jgi:zinc transport system permease protein
MDFWQALQETNFLRNTLVIGLLASVACGIVGSYVVARRITYIAGGISHCVLGGLGAAHYVRVVYHWDWLSPLYGALAAALLAAAIIGLVSLRAKEREDTVIGALWSVGMATGIIFLVKTPGYNADLMSYLFGNILIVGPQEIRLMLALDIVVVAATVMFYNQFMAVCFDEEYARLRGIKVELYYLLLLGLTAVTVVVMLAVVGIVLVIALLTLPAAIGGQFARSLWQMMGLATLLTVLVTVSGVMVSFPLDLPSGATIIVISGGIYLAVTAGRAVWKWRR